MREAEWLIRLLDSIHVEENLQFVEQNPLYLLHELQIFRYQSGPLINHSSVRTTEQMKLQVN